MKPSQGNFPGTAIHDFQLNRVPEDFYDNPYPYYAALREVSPFHPLPGGGIFLTRYADVAAIYRDPRVSSDKKKEFALKFGETPLFEHHTNSLVFNDPPLHTRVRRLIMGAMNQRAIARMESGVERLLERLLAELSERDQVDLIADFAAQIPVEVIGNLLDVPREARTPLRHWSLAILSALEPVPSATVLQNGNQAVREFLDFLRGLVSHRRRYPGDSNLDMLTRLIGGETNGESLSESELLHNCIFLLNAGHETTTNTIGNGMHALMSHRDQLARLVRQPELLSSAVEELLRYESPLQLNNRLATADIELAGLTIVAGTFITLGIGAANRDPAEFSDPKKLDIARKPNRHLAFGHGDHACAGMNVARLEARIAIGKLVVRFPNIDFAVEPERDRRIRFRGFKRLPVSLNA